MKTEKYNITYLQDYTPPPFLIMVANLQFILDPKETIVKSELHIKRNLAVKNAESLLQLDGVNLQLQEIKLNQKKLSTDDYQVSAEFLTISHVPDDFILEITVKICPEKNLTCCGLYISDNNFCTQNEPQGFRAITYFIDRPDILTKFTTTIIADQSKYPVLLANGNLIYSKILDNNQHLVTWQDPFPKSPYLFALVAGNFSWIEDYHLTNSGRKIILRIFAEPKKLDQCYPAMQFFKQAMVWDEKNFGLEYDLDLYQIVVVNDFVFGAMENKGLNIFNSTLLLASPLTATDADYKKIAAAVAHEYFHNWTGNRVTCRNWFQIGLKEGLTTLREQLFMEDLYGKPINRIDTIKTIYNQQFAEDSSPLAHPIRLQSYIEVNNFYTSTVYYKSAEVARMLQTLFGEKIFQQIMKTFLKEFDGQAVTIEDFLQVATKITKTNLEQFKFWYDRSGTLTLKISDEWHHDGTYCLTIEQKHNYKQTGENYYLPLAISLIDSDGNNSPTEILTIKNQKESFTFKNFAAKPIPSILRNFSAPVKIDYPCQDEELLFLIHHDQDPINRWESCQKLLRNTIVKFCREEKTNTIPPTLQQMFKTILGDNKIDPALTAQMLQLPTESYLLEIMPNINLETIFNIGEFIKLELATKLKNLWLKSYHFNATNQAYEFKNIAIGKRSLKNLCLYYLMYLNTEEVFSICQQQLENSDNLTDTLASLTAIANSNYEKKGIILENYYQKWQNQPNLINKWFAINANIKLAGNLKRVQKLLHLPAFNLKNPNNVYAVIRTFCENNLINFHGTNGEGYQFLAEQIIAIDKFNPHLAAIIAVPLTQGYKLDQVRQQLMKQQLIKIKQTPNLSKNVFEIVSKVS